MINKDSEIEKLSSLPVSAEVRKFYSYVVYVILPLLIFLRIIYFSQEASNYIDLTISAISMLIIMSVSEAMSNVPQNSRINFARISWLVVGSSGLFLICRYWADDNLSNITIITIIVLGCIKEVFVVISGVSLLRCKTCGYLKALGILMIIRSVGFVDLSYAAESLYDKVPDFAEFLQFFSDVMTVFWLLFEWSFAFIVLKSLKPAYGDGHSPWVYVGIVPVLVFFVLLCYAYFKTFIV